MGNSKSELLQEALRAWREYFIGDDMAYELPAEYADRIKEARERFSRPLKCPEPKYLMFRTEGPRATYIPFHKEPNPHSVIISEHMLKDYTNEELSGVLAHELAHAERIAEYGRETRQEWEVDMAAVDLVDAQSLLALHRRVKKEVEDFFGSNHHFGRFFEISLPYHTENEELMDRIKRLEFLKAKST